MGEAAKATMLSPYTVTPHSMRSPARTSSVRQLNVHPSTLLRPKEAPCVARPLVIALGFGRSHRVQTIARR
jgi:hypothetical protein